MGSGTIDLSKPENIVREVFEANHEIKDQFQRDFSEKILAFSEALAPAFARFPALDKLGVDERRGMVVNFVFGVLDDLLISTKLFVSGHAIPSGNLMRQAVEGICVALLCAAAEPVLIDRHFEGRKKKRRLVSETKRIYWRLVLDGHESVYSHNAIKQLQMNQVALGIDPEAVKQLRRSRDFYNQFSHPNLLGSAFRMEFGRQGMIFVGGSYDEGKRPEYLKELEGRKNLAAIVPQMMDELIHRLALPVTTQG